VIRGIYTSASALRAATIHQGRLAHNLANLQTSGFKQILTSREAYQLQTMGHYSADSTAYLNALGNLEQGLLVPEQIVDFTQGNLNRTDRPLDLAVEGEGFFRIGTPEGEQYTRDGSFHRDSAGQLVTRDGYYVLGSNGEPIILPLGSPAVAGDGSIFVGGQLAGQVGLVSFADTNELQQQNNNFYTGEGAQPLDPNTVSLKQGYLEGSNVDENAQVMEMMRILRLYEASQKALQIHDSALSQTISVGQI
jgi:flagellar basal body rod protein FlgG